RLLLPAELAFRYLVISAAVHLDAQAAVRPQLPLGTKPVWGLQNAQQHRRPDRADRRNLAKPLPSLVPLALRQQLSAHCLAQRSQVVQLLIIKFSSQAHSRFIDFPEPLGPMTWAIHLLAATRDRPAAIDGLDSGHDPAQVPGDGQITAHQLLQSSQTMISVIDRLDLLPI